MIVRMLSCECGPNGNFQPGELRDVAEDHGHQLIESGHAERISQRVVEKAIIGPPETAIMLDPEIAIIAPIETRRPGRPKK